MQQPFLFTVIWKDKKNNFCYFYTNNEETANKKKVLKNGEMYINTRYNSQLRLYKAKLKGYFKTH